MEEIETTTATNDNAIYGTTNEETEVVENEVVENEFELTTTGYDEEVFTTDYDGYTTTAYEVDTDYDTTLSWDTDDFSSSDAEAASGIIALILGLGAVMYIVALAVGILMIVAIWKMFKKANKPGWAAIVPIYNIWVLFEIIYGNGVKMFLQLIPFYNIYFAFKYNIDLAKKFGKGTGLGIVCALAPYIGYLVLGFGKAQYEGSEALETAPVANDGMNSYPSAVTTETPVNPEAPVMETPVAPVETPVAEAPVMETPIAPVETPVAEAPVMETPVAPVETPVVEAPVETPVDNNNQTPMI